MVGKSTPQSKARGLSRYLNKIPGWSAIRDRNKGRDPVQAETRSEDHLHPASGQIRLIAQEREVYRNTVFGPSTAEVLKNNVVGAVGGRLTFTTADEAWNAKAGKAFRHWAKRCEFQKSKCLNETLALLLAELSHNGGDAIVVHDKGVLTGGNGSGKIRVFESDEIANISDAEFKRIWGDGYHQTRGIVTDRFGRICGASVSNALRGKETFDDIRKVIILRLDTPGEWDGADWIFVSKDWRLGQIRGVATVSHIVNTLDDLQSIKDSEVAAAKINAALGLVVSDKDSQAENVDLERGLPPIPDCAGGEGGNGNAPDPDAPQEPPPPAATITGLREGMAAIVDVSPGKDVKSFDTVRPNLSVPEFIRREESQCATIFGFGEVFLTLNPTSSYSACRGAMKLAQVAFRGWQKKLERDLLDWLAVSVVKWLGLNPPDDLDEYLFWQWPKMPEIDERAYQTALEKRYSNLTASLKGETGYEWEAHIDQVRREIAYCKFGKAWAEHLDEVQVVHPSERTVSGQIAEQPEPITDGENTPPENNEDVEPTEGEAN